MIHFRILKTMNKVKTKQTVYIEQQNETSYEVSFFYTIVKGFRIIKKMNDEYKNCDICGA